MFYISKLNIEKHPLISESAELTFNPLLNYLVGVNGSGKTNLLEIIKVFYTQNFETLTHFNSDISMSALFKSDTNKKWSIKLEYKSNKLTKFKDDEISKIDLGDIANFDQNECKASNILKVNISYDNNEIIIQKSKDDSFFIIEKKKYKVEYIKNVISFYYKIFNKIHKDDFDIPEVLLTYFNFIMQSPYITRFDENFSFEKQLFKRNSTLHVSKDKQFIRQKLLQYDAFLSTELDNSGNLSSILYDLRNSYLNNKEYLYKESLILSKVDSSLIKTLVKVFCFEDIIINYRVHDLTDDENEVDIKLSISNISIILKNNIKIDFSDLSYGERKLFCLLLFLQENPILILDEPVNGLHYEYIEILNDELLAFKSQTFIANQNPGLFDVLDFENSDDFEKMMTFCRIRAEKMQWTNPTKSETSEFMEDYSTSFLSTGKILKKLELW